MAGNEISMSPEALARMGNVTRTRERARIAAIIEERATSLTDATALYAFAEELRTEGLPVKPVAQANAEEVAAVDEIVAQEEAGNALPEVHHVDDDEMALSMVENRRRRGIGLAGMQD